MNPIWRGSFSKWLGSTTKQKTPTYQKVIYTQSIPNYTVYEIDYWGFTIPRGPPPWTKQNDSARRGGCHCQRYDLGESRVQDETPLVVGGDGSLKIDSRAPETNIQLEPKWGPLFWLEKAPCFGGLTFKHRGRWGSRQLMVWFDGLDF